ncbi:MAG: sterol-binding protein [Rickettsiales bacterium]|mgnify:CR=1 FL=1|nr:sterol-binding protein [Rickettsiales bacterium]|tara:strand:- start:988 stop:1314 length:327 start_codon:yes stop_codon:yes gene_type:complete
MAANPTEFFKSKAEQINSAGDALSGINAVYQFNLSGDDGGSWVIDLASDSKGVRTGEEDGAQCVISMTSADFMSMIQGSLNPQMAFMTGKLRVKGDMGLALKLQTILG